ncbi:MAG: hypothetical protein IT238_08600 [Bacteroidia bacterium]|nr:hypothetical protein [Bacteroidia bacterium]MCZ2248650.1 hypothetical protein [Bacteroidia bacterium]
MDRICLDCGEKIVGRSDKKFCNDQCRNNYNNKLSSTTNSEIRYINNILRKNRRILEEIADNDEGKAKISLTKLNEKGFNFKYFTHIYQTKTGNVYHFCYEYGYLGLDNNYYMIVKRTEN